MTIQARSFRYWHVPGQVPKRVFDKAQHIVTEMVGKPKELDPEALLDRPIYSADQAVKDLGMSEADVTSWRQFLEAALGSTIEGHYRQQVMERIRMEGHEPEVRNVLFRRALSLWRNHVNKAMGIVTVDQLKKAQEPSKPIPQPRRIHTVDELKKAGPYVGPKGGKWKDPQHTIPWTAEKVPKFAQSLGEAFTPKKKAGKPLGPGKYDKLAAEAGMSHIEKLLVRVSTKGSLAYAGGIATGALSQSAKRALQKQGLGDAEGNLTPKGLSRAEALYEKLGAPKDFLEYRFGKSLEKAERGGTYYRRVPKGKGQKGFKYYYNPDKYHEREDAHPSGEEMKKRAMKSAVLKLLDKAGPDGCEMRDLRELAKKYGGKELAGMLREQCGPDGGMSYGNGRFTKRMSKGK